MKQPPSSRHEPAPGPLPPEEFAERRQRVAASLEQAGLDALVVIADRHKTYLGATASNTHWPSPLVIVPGQRPVLVARRFDVDAYEAAVSGCDVEPFFGDDAIDVWVNVMRGLGVRRGRIGLELDAPGLSPLDAAIFAARMPDLDVVDASRIVSELEMIKSPREIALMSAVAELNRAGFDAFLDGWTAGRTDLEIQHRMVERLVTAGSHNPHVEVVQGKRTAIPHAGYDPSAATDSAASIAYTEFSGSLHGYSAGQVRTVIRRPLPEAEELFEVALSALEMVGSTLRPGVRACDVDHAARSVIERAGRGSSFRHRLGYSIGLLWGEAPISVDLSPSNRTVLQPGMCFHTPIILFEAGRFAVGISETWLVTDDGCRPITVLPRRTDPAC